MRKYTIIIFILCGLFIACNNENEEINNQEPGIYSTYITLYTEEGNGNDILTKGIDEANGYFTNDYPYDYIYLHSADNETGDNHKSLKIPLKNTEYCGECKGIHLELEENTDGTYTITAETENGGYQSITLDNNQNVYFSTIPNSIWKATPETDATSPVTGSPVFKQDPEVNEELLRSQNEYTKDDLITLLQTPVPYIDMVRHCTGFRISFMFTEIESDDDSRGSVDEDEWKEILGEENPYTNFYIKLYIGPNFCGEYDVYNDVVPTDDKGGYYVTNEQRYQQFEEAYYSYTGGDNVRYNLEGFGYLTDGSYYLISPLNQAINEPLSVYAFIKYSNEEHGQDDPFWTSDEGAKWFKTEIKSMTLESNIIHFVIMAFDIDNLRTFLPEEEMPQTRSAFSSFEEINIRPIATHIEYKSFHKE